MNNKVKLIFWFILIVTFITAISCTADPPPTPAPIEPVTTARVTATITYKPTQTPLAAISPTSSIIIEATTVSSLEASESEFSFSPQLEELLDCVSAAWWEEDGQAILFVKCPTFNGPQEGLWRLELATRVVTQVGGTPTRPRIPDHLLPLIPDSVRDVFVHSSPSNERVIYLEQLDPYRNQPTPTPVADPADLGELPIIFEYLVYFINQAGEVVTLGQIEGTPFDVTWSEDEQLVFMASTLMDGDVPGGWLADLEGLTLEEMTPPTFDGSVISSHFCFSSLQPGGEAILYRPCFSEADSPYLLWYYQAGEVQEIKNNGSSYIWLGNGRYILFSDDKTLVLYDTESGEAETIKTDANANFRPRQNIQHVLPQGDRIIFQSHGNNLSGLWLLTLNLE